MIKKAVIPAAGYGTRFLPATKTIPKEMFPIIDTPTLQLIVQEAVEAGIKEILIIVSLTKDAVINHFDNNLELETFLRQKNKLQELKKIKDVVNLANIHFVIQKEQLGLGHAILQAQSFIGNEPFAVLLGDDLFKGETPAIKELLSVYKTYQNTIIGTFEVKAEETNKYGICDPEKAVANNIFKLKDIVEKPEPKVAPSLKAAAGRYILTPAIFKLLENQNPGYGGEIQLTDSIRDLISFESVYSYDIKAKRYDIGTRLGFIDATLDFGLLQKDLHNDLKALIIKKAEDLLNFK